jgi:ribonuclease P protein component
MYVEKEHMGFATVAPPREVEGFWPIEGVKAARSYLFEVMGEKTFKKSEVLRSRSQITRTLDDGRKKRIGTYCTVVYTPNKLDRVRLGIIASKKIGNAVVRNKAKRKIREVFREIKSRINPAMDIVIISGKDLVLLPFSTLEQRILQVFNPNPEI